MCATLPTLFTYAVSKFKKQHDLCRVPMLSKANGVSVKLAGHEIGYELCSFFDHGETKPKYSNVRACVLGEDGNSFKAEMPLVDFLKQVYHYAIIHSLGEAKIKKQLDNMSAVIKASKAQFKPCSFRNIELHPSLVVIFLMAYEEILKPENKFNFLFSTSKQVKKTTKKVSIYGGYYASSFSNGEIRVSKTKLCYMAIFSQPSNNESNKMLFKVKSKSNGPIKQYTKQVLVSKEELIAICRGVLSKSQNKLKVPFLGLDGKQASIPDDLAFSILLLVQRYWAEGEKMEILEAPAEAQVA